MGYKPLYFALLWMVQRFTTTLSQGPVETLTLKQPRPFGNGILVEWQTPKTAPVTNYTVQCECNMWTTEAHTTDTSVFIMNLPPETRCRINQVKAWNEQSLIAETSLHYFATTYKREESPWNVVAIKIKRNTVLFWLAPNVADKNAVSYNIQSINNQNTKVENNFTTNKTFYILGNIRSDDTKRFSVKAVFDDGSVSASGETIFSPSDKTTPDVIYARKGQNVTFKWTLPRDFISPHITIKKHSTDQEVFRLNIRNNAISREHWLYAGRIKTLSSESHGLSFILSFVRELDAGFYMTRYMSNDNIHGQLLVILEKPQKPNIRVNQTAVVGNPLVLSCVALSRSRPSYHSLPSYCTWKKNGDTISTSENMAGNDHHLLTVDRVKLSDRNASFTCRCHDDHGPLSDESDKAIIFFDPMYGPQEIILKPKPLGLHYSMQEGSSKNLVNCSAECNPACNMTWQKYSPVDKTWRTFVKGSRLQMNNVTRENYGPYRCVAHYSYKNMTKDLPSKSITLEIEYKPEIFNISLETDISTDKTNTMISKEFTVSEGEKMKLRCNAKGVPIPSISWSRDGHLQSETLDLIQIAYCNSTGSYKCVARNTIGMAEQMCKLFVRCSPRIAPEKFENLFGKKKDDIVVLQIPVTAFPPPDVLLPPNLNATINIVDVNQFTYQIILTHKVAEDSFKVHHVEITNGIGKTLSVSFEIKAEDVPEVPINFTHTLIDDHTLELSWISNFNGGKTQTFTISYKTKDDWKTDKVLDPGRHLLVRHRVEDLVAGSEYVFVLIAVNTNGQSEAVNITIKTKVSALAPGDQGGSTGLVAAIVIILFLILIVLAVIGVLIYRKKKRGKLGLKKNSIEYSQGMDIKPTVQPETGSKAAAVLGEIGVPTKPTRRKSGQILVIGDDKVVYSVVEEIDKKEPLYENTSSNDQITM